jgi:hypothetical protein
MCTIHTDYVQYHRNSAKYLGFFHLTFATDWQNEVYFHHAVQMDVFTKIIGSGVEISTKVHMARRATYTASRLS